MSARRCAVAVLLFIICDVSGDCVISVQKDFGNPSPVFLRDGSYMTLTPQGTVTFKRSETVLVACPGDKRHIVLANKSATYATLEAHCVGNATFRVERWIGQFKDITCNAQPWFSAQETKQACHTNSKIYKVGYQIKSTLHPLYEACFDQALMKTSYVQHRLTPASRHAQLGTHRPQFIEGGLFDKVRMSQLYKMEHQKSRLDTILGSGMAENYITNKQFLSRGHLAARADFSLGAEMRATFHYVNSAPQWMRGNAGDWQALEDAVRRRAHTLGSSVTVLTGTHGVMTLADANGHLQPFYLTADDNNNGVVPVPLYFYKLVYDPVNKTATAFVTINSSFYNRTMLEELSFCSDICEQNRQFSWLKWRDNDGTHSFCCAYDDFVETINYLPKLDVRGTFY